ncbi:hypothetical protein H0H92_010950 [Tricholoma furcatifolium]|nr:hypothetical protein H0H92_010950 [Tricholoma furcatifolium]
MSSTSPTFRTRIAAIDTDLTPDLNYAISSSTSTPNDIPSLRISQVPSHSNTTSPIRPIRHQANPTNRARTESRKLLAHVLAQLESRAMPPDIFDTLNHPEDLGTENNLGALLNVMRGTSNPRKVQQESRRQASMRNGEDSDSDADEEHEFSTDATYGLMLQLKDLLSISVDQDWHILDDNPATQPNDVFYEAGSKSPMSPFRRTRTSFQPGGHRSRSHSPSYGGLGPTRTSDLLSTCISVLASVVLEDCRYQIASPRPSCPPNALQALTLDVAQFLLHTHRHDFNVTSKIGFAMIPAFSTFRPAMHGRLLTFFENAVIRCMLEDLAQIQGVNDIVPSTNDFEKPLNSAGSSVVAIHIDAVQELPHPGLGYSRWKPWSMLPDHALKLRSTYAPAQSMALYSFSSLVAPLIAAILDSVDLEPKPDARTDVLHRFRRLLRLIVESKFDAYSDVLQVVGHHTHRARHIALSILCAVWPNAIGHVVISRPFTDLYHLDTALPQQQTSDVPPCSSKNLSSDLVDITWDELHRSFVDFYRDLVQYSYDDLTKLSYEEVSIMHSILWVQAQIISNGVTLGSVVIARHAGMAVEKAEEYGLQEFELHSMIRWCESLLSSDKLSCSNALDDYLEGNALKRSDHLMMFNWTHLMYIRSIIQSPYTEQSFSHGSSSDLLSVTQPGFLHTSPSNDSSSYPFDIVPLSHMRDALGHVLNVHSDAIARIFLSHLHRLGLFERIDGRLALFDGENVTNIYCSFPLPFGLDLSPSVEGLVAAVEGCLQDLDLSVIEVGLLLLVRRLWPNGLTSDYALRRLTRCVVSWILAEDDHLAIVLRDYLGKGQPLPGVRPSQDPITWPLSDKARSTSANSNNGGDYLATRRSLLMRYAKPWLQALHSLDSVLYASLVFDTCTENDGFFQPMHSLSRLFSREPGNSSEKADPTISKASVVPWRVVTRIASGGQDGLQRSLQWLWLFARSGVDIPLTIFETFSALAAQYNSPLSESLLMARGIMASTWLKPKGRQEIQGILSRLHERHKTEIIGALRDVQPSNDVYAQFMVCQLVTDGQSQRVLHSTFTLKLPVVIWV